MIGLWLFYSQGSCPSFLINKLAATFQKNLRKYCKMKTILLDKAQQSEQNGLGFLKLCELWRLYSWLYVFELSVWPVHLLDVNVFNTGASDQSFNICSFPFHPCPWFCLPLFTLFTNWDNTRGSCLNAQGYKMHLLPKAGTQLLWGSFLSGTSPRDLISTWGKGK